MRSGTKALGSLIVSRATPSTLICPNWLSQLALAYSVPNAPFSKVNSSTCNAPLMVGLSKSRATCALPEANPLKLTEWNFTKSSIYSTFTFLRSTVSESSLLLLTLPFMATCCCPLVIAKWSTTKCWSLYFTLAGCTVSTVSPMLNCDGRMSRSATAFPSAFCVKLMLAFKRPCRRCLRA